MSDPHDSQDPATSSDDNPDHAPADHVSPIKTPRQLIVTVLLSFLVPIFGIIMLVSFVDFGERSGAGSDAMTAQSIAERIQPVGSVKIRDASSPGVARTGEQVYQGQCSACHAIGALGSPKFGDATAWAPRIAKGYDALLTSALKGKGNMTAQGGGEYTDYEVGRAVVYMADHGGASFAEPPAPAASAASEAASSAAAAMAAPASAASAAN